MQWNEEGGWLSSGPMPPSPLIPSFHLWPACLSPDTCLLPTFWEGAMAVHLWEVSQATGRWPMLCPSPATGEVSLRGGRWEGRWEVVQFGGRCVPLPTSLVCYVTFRHHSPYILNASSPYTRCYLLPSMPPCLPIHGQVTVPLPQFDALLQKQLPIQHTTYHLCCSMCWCRRCFYTIYYLLSPFRVRHCYLWEEGGFSAVPSFATTLT